MHYDQSNHIRAFITGIAGITGQDGSYLAVLLLGKGYEVHGPIQRASTFNIGRLDHLYQDPQAEGAKHFLHYGSDEARLVTLLHKIDPDEVYNLGAQSHVRVRFDEPEHAGDTTGVGVGATRPPEAVRLAGVYCK
ncbi:GDP-mannose 4,6-dehydratase [Nocardioides salarius]|uniref:GDP-mannose 4,6-dehydratase n=1 Tax=Nocardioides salarius TaxID=374513 RepID=A0ABS2M920_9ACTN|nr:GDP-mannose 4,6-dehydratase [Nocardioides salarius]